MAESMTADERRAAVIERVELVVGMEVHVELATRSKMFARAPSPAHPEFQGAAPNTLVDPVVLALPGALPVMNREAVELSMLVGFALGSEIPGVCKWDRKGYFYPDLPKAYQLSQYDLPLCVGGRLSVPAYDADGFLDPGGTGSTVRITRAHLEEDAGKLMHELPSEFGGGPLDSSIVDLNRAGTPLLEIVTEPDLTDSAGAVAFCRTLRDLCRWLGVTHGVMQKGHIRFEPNINCRLTLAGGRVVRTPIVEVKNLNSFKAVRGAIDYELGEQPGRWVETGVEFGPGTKQTRGWDDGRGATTLQREKEDAHDYRYFPDPDLPPVVVDDAWREAVRDRLPESAADRFERAVGGYGLGAREAQTLTSERGLSDCFEQIVGGDPARAKQAANLLLQVASRLAGERGVGAWELVPAAAASEVVTLRLAGEISSNGADALFASLADEPGEVRSRAESLGLMVVRDDGQLEAWCREVIEANEAVCEQVRGGKTQAVGRLVGEVMKKAKGGADGGDVRQKLFELLGVQG
ncbi:MAG: Asp-tRNA(Asn)/Glu-tRNA(Gln) amidotransferase subunit GatB [Planctomycetota bacterium]